MFYDTWKSHEIQISVSINIPGTQPCPFIYESSATAELSSCNTDCMVYKADPESRGKANMLKSNNDSSLGEVL